jgi:hypothetical protein
MSAALERFTEPAELPTLLDSLDAQRQHLADQGDLEALAYGLVALRAIKTQVDALTRATENDVADLMPSKMVEVPGVGLLERRQGAKKTVWDSDAVLREVVKAAIVGPDGELPATVMEAVHVLVEALKAAAPVDTPSFGWRVGGLKALDIDPTEYRTQEPGRISVQVTR